MNKIYLNKITKEVKKELKESKIISFEGKNTIHWNNVFGLDIDAVVLNAKFHSVGSPQGEDLGIIFYKKDLYKIHILPIKNDFNQIHFIFDTDIEEDREGFVLINGVFHLSFFDRKEGMADIDGAEMESRYRHKNILILSRIGARQ